jgi:hypothetical protein
MSGAPAASAAAPGRSLARAWYLPLLGGLLPLLLLGFLYSALADRTIFALWALAAAAGWVVVLRAGLQLGWPRGRRIAALAGFLAVVLAAFALLEARHQEILDLGFRAVYYKLYHPAATAPETAWTLAGISALISIVCITFPLSKSLGEGARG